MSFLKRFSVCGFFAALVLWSAPAMCQTLASFSIPVFSAGISGGASVGSSSIILPNSGVPTFAVNFVLPRDYVNNDEVLVVVHLVVAAFPCAVRLVPTTLRRERGGANSLSSLDGVSGGNPVVNFPGTGTTVLKNFRIAPAGLVTDLRRGDSIFLFLTREADTASDSCNSDTHVTGIDVRYPIP